MTLLIGGPLDGQRHDVPPHLFLAVLPVPPREVVVAEPYPTAIASASTTIYQMHSVEMFGEVYRLWVWTDKDVTWEMVIREKLKEMFL